MKKNSILALSLLTLMLTMLAVPAYAAPKAPNKVIFRANGKVTNYLPYDPNSPNSVLGGDWNINVKDGKVDFKLFYKEWNIYDYQYANPDTVDHFTFTLVSLNYIDVVPGQYCYIEGHFNVDKFAWGPAGSIPPVTHKPNFFGDVYGWVWIGPGYMRLVVDPWYLEGTTTSMTMK